MPISFAGLPCLDPKHLREVCEHHYLPVQHWYAKANSFVTRAGRKPGTGSFLLSGRDYDLINFAADADAVFWSDIPNGKKITLKQLTITAADCVVPGHLNDGQAVYLFDAADVRWNLERIPIDKAFNVSKPDGSAYQTPTLNAGVPWTWAQLVQNLWTASTLGGTATLPFTPNGTPENLIYYGWSAWGALCDVLDRIGCVADFDPELVTFTIRRIGADSTELNAVNRLTRLDREWDVDPANPTRALQPEKIRVMFTRFPAPTDGDNPYYSVDTATTVRPGLYTGTMIRLYDDMVAQGAAGAPANAAAIATRAAERVADWMRKFETRDQRVSRVYTDVQPDPLNAVGGYATAATLRDISDGLKTEYASAPDQSLERWRPGTVAVAGGTAAASDWGYWELYDCQAAAASPGAGEVNADALVYKLVKRKLVGTGKWADDGDPTDWIAYVAEPADGFAGRFRVRVNTAGEPSGRGLLVLARTSPTESGKMEFTPVVPEWTCWVVTAHTPIPRSNGNPLGTTPPLYTLRLVELIRDLDAGTAGNQEGWREVSPAVEVVGIRAESKRHSENRNSELLAPLLVGQHVQARPSPTDAGRYEITGASNHRMTLKRLVAVCSECISPGVMRTNNVYDKLLFVADNLRVFRVPPGTGEGGIDDATAGQFDPPKDVGLYT